MATTPAPDLFTQEELEVASFLPEISGIVLESAPHVPLENFLWGKKRRRTEPPYHFKPEPDQAEPAGLGFTYDEQKKKKKKKEERAGRSDHLRSPFCFANSGTEKQIVHPPSNQVKKQKCQRKQLKENQDPLAVLYKKAAVLSREAQKLQKRLQRQCAKNLLLRAKHLKLVQPVIDPCRMEFDPKEKPADDVAQDAVAGPPTCQSDVAEDAVAQAQLQIQQETRTSPSAAQYRPRFR